MNDTAMLPHSLDLDLLRTFVGIVDSGGFTRAGQRLHRTQSTISQQIKRLEDHIGQPLLLRQGRQVQVTEAGETLLGYARRLLALDDEARATLVRREVGEIIRLGVSEDFASRHLPRVLTAFSRANPQVRLDIRADLSVKLRADFDLGELDVALFKGEQPMAGAVGVWPEPVFWTASAHESLPPLHPLPLALFPQGCLFRRQVVDRLDQSRRPWRLAYASPSLAGIQAAVASGMALAPLGQTGLHPDLRVLEAAEMGLPDLSPVWFSLVVRPGGASRHHLAADIARVVGALDLPVAAQ
ncbi:putative DNA-binding transcriptional repressor of flagellar, motility and chemotaxis genes [Magnetospirillum gryphiswaldense MSR-1 v2]|uniref:DNA-binding transcriptional repressor of flagellar, motility and chemotaxis genes n=2 Tax=Magnetospirillum gryphiswaldense TaxID=55518 RepID=V6EZR9_MAGGM|nr:putative DNA-binding transcriptional repressor of flagellar, motility and chemotaxis genes [Magnetospirillum gryphiswaldense MSR-1 v2]